jgi:hypothetical protein
MPDTIVNLNKHPAEHFLRYLVLRDPGVTDAMLTKSLDDWGFLQPAQTYWGFLRQSLNDRPAAFDPTNRLHQPSMRYLRDKKVYDLFYPTEAVNEAWDILADPNRRFLVEQALMGRLELKSTAQKLNKKYNIFLTADGLQAFYHFFWNVKLMTFDEWGRFLYGRSAMYERHMALLNGPPSLAFFHLRLDQTIESKKMIQRIQEIAYHTAEEINTKPGTMPDKVKALALLGKTVVDCHNALSTSDMALKDVLQQFERWRMEHPMGSPPDIHELAPGGNYSGSGADEKKEEKVH